MTHLLCYTDAYQKSCEATIVEILEQGIILDRSVFYVQGGGQPGDNGVINNKFGSRIEVVNTAKDRESGKIVHLTENPAPQEFTTGQLVHAEINWTRRHQLMRMHSCLHLLCSLVDAPVTGGSISVEKSRLDFDLPEMTINKLQLTDQLSALIEQDLPLSIDSISDEELQKKPQLIRTMSVKPPTGQGRVRLINIEGVDLQPCGGTHVRSTGEIGPVRVSKIEKKGRQNRRVTIVFDV